MLVVTERAACASMHTIEVPLYSDFAADYDILRGSEEDWREIQLVFTSDTDDSPEDGDGADGEEMRDEFATIDREPDEAAVRAEAEEMVAELSRVEPSSGASWVIERLRRARTIYRFTPHHGDFERAMTALRAVMWCIQREVAGINYAEGEGWSNEDGCLVTWEFDREDGHEGPWHAAVLDPSGGWTTFRMDLGDPAHRRAFREGRLPAGIRLESKE